MILQNLMMMKLSTQVKLSLKMRKIRISLLFPTNKMMDMISCDNKITIRLTQQVCFPNFKENQCLVLPLQINLQNRVHLQYRARLQNKDKQSKLKMISHLLLKAILNKWDQKQFFNKTLTCRQHINIHSVMPQHLSIKFKNLHQP